jgi:hypothetical protein
MNEYFDTILIMLETIIVFPLEISFKDKVFIWWEKKKNKKNPDSPC